MYKHLILLYWPSQFQELTLHFSLSNVAKQLGLDYIEIRYGPNGRGFPGDGYNNSLVFFTFDPNREIGHINEIRRKCPNSKIIQFSGDTHYYGLDEKVFSQIDIHIDCMLSTKEKVEALGPKWYHFYWSISEKFISIIKEHQETPPKSIDVICLATAHTDYRKGLFDDVRSKYSLAADLKEFDISKIISKYKQSLIVLGTSSPCTIHFKHRSCKGFRDWIGPFCNSVLIYDDMEEMKLLDGIVPIYKYQDVPSMLNLIEKLKNDPAERTLYIDKQLDWAQNNTCDKQFLRILKDLI